MIKVVIFSGLIFLLYCSPILRPCDLQPGKDMPFCDQNLPYSTRI